MKTGYGLLLSAMTACIAGCATSTGNPQAREVVNVPLAASPHNTSRAAMASMVRRGEGTAFMITVGGVSPVVTTIPVRLYTYIYPGSCANLGPRPAYQMNRILSSDEFTVRGPWTLYKTAPVGFDQLRSGDYALVVRSTPWDGSVDLFCGNLKAQQPPAAQPMNG